MTSYTKKSGKISFSAPFTHSDWFYHENSPGWGEDGVKHMLEQCRNFGFNKILWRLYDCGRATYASKLVEPFKWGEHEEIYQYSPGFIDPPSPQMMCRLEELDYNQFDSLKAAIRIGHELGIEIHAWMTINEDDHGLGWPSRFTRQHPECRWVRRDGRVFHSQLSFAFQEVREYKLGLVKEALEYDIDGIFLDWIRTGDIRDNPQNDDSGVVDYGYEKPNIDTFIQKYGIDPHEVDNSDDRWVACRAEPLTEFMREARRVISQHSKPIIFSAMVQQPWAYRGILPEMVTSETPEWVRKMGGNRIDGSFKGLLCDVRTWANEGLVDEIVAAGYYTGDGEQEKVYRYLEAETNGNVPIWLYCWVPHQPEDFIHDLALAEKLGVNDMLFWEADYIDVRPEPQRRAIIDAITEYKKR